MAFTGHINCLNAGVWDERVQPRDDLEKYGKSCRVMRNFIPRTEGGAEKRHGDEWMGEAKYHDRDFGLVEFKLGNNTPYMLEMGYQYIRFWSNGLRILESEKNISNITTPGATLTVTVNSHGYSNGNVI
ncbi:MAG: hypothetical protein Q7Q73_07480 [Verrucomicrobiota bacterium JB024]|nr:hypothetical protein [Verrucomicrobiota bacterium JB024]